nr:MAG TPA: hypothetical protein [Caudoviricetes sp.]
MPVKSLPASGETALSAAASSNPLAMTTPLSRRE